MRSISLFLLVMLLCAALAVTAGCLPEEEEASEEIGTISASQWQELLTGVSFADETTGVVSGWGGKLLRTTDGGNNWVETNSGTKADLGSVAFLSDTVVIAVGAGGKMLRSTDAGMTWEELDSPTDETLNSIVSTGSGAAIAVGWNGTILTTADDGDTWTVDELDFPNNYISLDHNSGLSMTVSSGGFVYRSPDGLEWEMLVIPEDFTPAAVGQGGISGAMLVGEYGEMLVTNNNGTDWFESTSVNTADLLAVAYLGNGFEAVATGWDGVMLRTLDDGASWNSINAGTTATLRALEVVTPTLVYAVGDAGTIIVSTDGGWTWTTQRESAS